MAADPFSLLLQRAHQHAAEYLQRLPERPVVQSATREELLSALRTPLSVSGEQPESILDLLGAQAHAGTTACASPRYFGFVIGGSLPVALAADWMLSSWDQNAGIYVISPLVSVLEDVTAEWLLELFDLPRESGIGFVTGCQMANFTALAAARHAVLKRAGWDVEADGLYGAPRVNLIASVESHVTIDVAARYLGFGTRPIRRVESDGQGRMRVEHLRTLLAAVEGPTIVCAQAGNVNTGAFDPLAEIGELTRAQGAWLHVDGAFGLWARASVDRRPLADGIELADSWATDAHKWLNVPYDCGVVIVRDRDAHRAAMSSTAAYLIQTRGPERDPTDWVPEFSRRARSVPVYASLRALGRAGVADLIDRGCARARQFAQLLAAQPGVQVLNDVVLNQVLVRFADDDETTRRVVTGVQEEGTCWLSGTVWHGRAAMRISVSNWATSEMDVERSVEAILGVFARS